MATVLATRWWTPPLPTLSVLGQAVLGDSGLCIGIVAIESYAPAGHWKVYIGYGQGQDELADAQNIARNGMPIGDKEVACALFPDLDPDGFRY